MKYLLVLAVVLVAFYIWRNNRAARARERDQDAQQAQRKAPPNTLAQPDAIVTCRHCGVHLPSREAVKGTLGYYCGHAHQRYAEG